MQIILNYNKISPQYFLREIFEKTDDPFEKAKIRLTFNLSVFVIFLLVPLEVVLLASHLYYSFAITVLVNFSLFTCLFFLKYKCDLITGAGISTSCIFISLCFDLLFSKAIALADIVWLTILVMYAFFTLGKKWGIAILTGSGIVSLIYVRYVFYGNFHDENVYSSGQVIAFTISLICAYWMASFFVKEIRDAQKEAETRLKENLTGLKELNSELKKVNSELNVANKSLESFTYSVSHDLRAPLRGINGFTDVLIRKHAQGLNNEGRLLLKEVSEGAAKMNLLIENLLSFSRLGSKDLVPGRVNMNDLFVSVISEYEKNEGKIPAVFKINPMPPITGDTGLMRQVSYNLVSNAVKYSAKKEKPQIEIGAISEQSENIFYVKDNGIGFDRKYAGRLFNIFQRLHSENEFKGTGVGLAIVKQVITKHGGRVWAESKPNEGSTFYFSLPK